MVGGTRSVPVLITGCSSGIGRAAAISLHAAGLTVYATARQVDALAGLARQGTLRVPGHVNITATVHCGAEGISETGGRARVVGAPRAAGGAGQMGEKILWSSGLG